MGGTPGNALSLGWQQCYLKATDASIKNLGPEDTYWANDVALQTVNAWLSTDPDIKGYAYEYADGLNTALQAYDDLNVPIDDLTIALRTDEQTLFCTWKKMDDPNSSTCKNSVCSSVRSAIVRSSIGTFRSS